MDKDLDKIIRSDKNIYLYGASGGGLRVLFNLLAMNVKKDRIFFIDSNPLKMGTTHGERPVLKDSEFHKLDKNSFILISSTVYYEIEEFLRSKGFINFFYKKDLIFSEKIYEKFTKEFLSILEIIKSRANLDFDELYTLYTSLKDTKDVEGSIAEVGTYRGGSAFLLSAFSYNKKVFLFDTYEGLPDSQRTIEGEPSQGWLSNTSIDYVKDFVLNSGIELSKLFLLKGLFPQSAENIKVSNFSLVHLDTDLYSSTFDSLKYFYPKLSKKGRIIIHDYNCFGCPGVKKAVKQFILDTDSNVINLEISESQLMIIK